MSFEESVVREKRIETRDGLYEKVESKVQSILSLRKFIDGSGDLPSEDLISKLEVEIGQIKNGIDPQKVAKYELFLEKNKRFQEVMRKQDEITMRLYVEPEMEDGDDENGEMAENDDILNFEYVPNEELEQEVEQLEFESSELFDELKELKNDDDVAFILKLEDFKKNLIQKKEEVLALKNKIEKDPAFISKFIFDKYVPKDGFEIQSSGFCVNIILSEDDYQKILGNKSIGMHLQGSVVNIIKDGPDRDGTIRHEENHNNSESFVPRVIYIDSFVRRLEEQIKSLDKLRNLAAPTVISDKAEHKIQNDIADYYKCNYSEIIADIDRLPTGDMHTFLINYEKAERKLRSFVGGVKDAELKDKLDKKIDEMEKKFIKYFFDLSNIFYFANRIGKAEEAKGLTILFGNGSGIRKIERHLRNYDPSYDDAILLRRFTGEMDYLKGLESINSPAAQMLEFIFGGKQDSKSQRASLEFGIRFDDLENIKKIENFVVSGNANDAEETAIEDRMYEMAEQDFFKGGNYDFSNKGIGFYMEIIRHLEKINDFCGLSESFVGSFKYELFANYVAYVFSRKDFSELESGYGDGFGGFFENDTMEGAIIEELNFEFKDYHTKNGNIRSPKLRRFLERIGIDPAKIT